MKRIISIIAFISVYTFVYCQNQQLSLNDYPNIEVTGTSEMEITPNEIYISIEINEKDNKAKESVEDLERKMVKTFKSLGIDIQKDLQILDFSSNFKAYWLKKSDILTSKKYQLLVHDAKLLGPIFLETEKLGISNISITKTDHSDIEKFKEQVKINAIKAAREKAEKLAEAINQKAGKAIVIQERNYRPYKSAYMVNSQIKVRGVSNMMEEEAMPEIEFEKIKLEYEIFVRFILE